MKKIVKLILRWRTRRLFNRWVVFYLKRGMTPTEAVGNALKIFEWLSPNLEDFSDWYRREYFGVTPNRKTGHSE